MTVPTSLLSIALKAPTFLLEIFLSQPLVAILSLLYPTKSFLTASANTKVGSDPARRW